MQVTNARFEIIYQGVDNASVFLFARQSKNPHLFSLYRVDMVDHPGGEQICPPQQVNHRAYHRQFIEEDKYLKKGDLSGFFSAQGANDGIELCVDGADIVIGSLTDNSEMQPSNAVLLIGASYFYTKFEKQKKSKEKNLGSSL